MPAGVRRRGARHCGVADDDGGWTRSRPEVARSVALSAPLQDELPTDGRRKTSRVQVRRVKIERYRGINKLEWHPTPGLNCLVGAGDVGKTTVLEAISTVLSPAPGRVASEYDYFNAEVAEGFRVELLVGNLSDEVLASWSPAPLWTWFPDEKRSSARS